MRRKIIFFTTSLTPGGAERVLCGAIENSVEELEIQAVICLYWTPDLRLKARIREIAPVIELVGNPNANLFEQCLRVLRICWCNRDAIYQGWMYHGSALASFFWCLLGWRNTLLWSIHSSGVAGTENKYSLPVKLFGLGLVCRITNPVLIFCGEASRIYHLEHWHWPGKYAHVLMNGINTRRFTPSAEIYRKIRTELLIPEGALLLGYVGRWHPDKDVETLCRALACLESTGFELVVVFCGNGLHLQHHGFAEAILAASKAVRCIGLGEVADSSLLIPAFDFMCLCSRREASPLVLCEALSCGVPCIATDVGDCKGIINGFGRLSPAGDYLRLAQSIVEYAGILRERDHWRIRQGARKWAAEMLDEIKATKRYISLLDAVCRQNKPVK